MSLFTKLLPYFYTKAQVYNKAESDALAVSDSGLDIDDLASAVGDKAESTIIWVDDVLGNDDRGTVGQPDEVSKFDENKPFKTLSQACLAQVGEPSLVKIFVRDNGTVTETTKVLVSGWVEFENSATINISGVSGDSCIELNHANSKITGGGIFQGASSSGEFYFAQSVLVLDITGKRCEFTGSYGIFQMADLNSGYIAKFKWSERSTFTDPQINAFEYFGGYSFDWEGDIHRSGYANGEHSLSNTGYPTWGLENWKWRGDVTNQSKSLTTMLADINFTTNTSNRRTLIDYQDNRLDGMASALSFYGCATGSIIRNNHITIDAGFYNGQRPYALNVADIPDCLIAGNFIRAGSTFSDGNCLKLNSKVTGLGQVITGNIMQTDGDTRKVIEINTANIVDDAMTITNNLVVVSAGYDEDGAIGFYSDVGGDTCQIISAGNVCNVIGGATIIPFKSTGISTGGDTNDMPEFLTGIEASLTAVFDTKYSDINTVEINPILDYQTINAIDSGDAMVIANINALASATTTIPCLDKFHWKELALRVTAITGTVTTPPVVTVGDNVTLNLDTINCGDLIALDTLAEKDIALNKLVEDISITVANVAVGPTVLTLQLIAYGKRFI